MDFDFEHVEKNKTNEMLADIEAKINGNGLGIPQLHLVFPILVQRFTGIVVSCILLAGMFVSSGKYINNFFTSGFSTAALCLLIVLAGIFTLRLRQKEEIVLKRIFESNPKTNTFMHYYRDYVEAGKAGKDIRIFHQQPAIKEIVDYWMNAGPWHEYFHFEGKLGGITAAANALIGGCVYLLIGLRSLAGMYGIGSVVQYVGAVTSLVENLTNFINECGGLVANSRYLAQFFEYLDLPDERYRGSITTEKRSDNEYEIEFHNVSFKYPGTETYALKNLSLKFHVGQRLAVVGMNGSGKTTMIKLLCRLYDPTEGQITLNRINIKKYDYMEYMGVFSVVFQDFKLFSYTLGQNVGASADIDRAKAEVCLQKAGFSKRLENLPKGLDTYLYKGFDVVGVEMSGGEAQKFALAWALYKDAPFIVLDEPTAALDPIAEFEVYSKFNEIIGNKTAIYISHRLSYCRF
ncbi:MAG: ATP-binding cassette domain-containing protein, partial [Pseudomonadota bacterium]